MGGGNLTPVRDTMHVGDGIVVGNGEDVVVVVFVDIKILTKIISQRTHT